MKGREVAKRSTITDWCLVAFTCALAVLGYYQWKTMSNQLNVMQNDERAWIHFGDGTDGSLGKKLTDFAAEQPVVYPFEIKNTGKTPARNVAMEIFLEIVPATLEPSLYKLDDPPHYPHTSITTGMMAPGADLKDQVVRVQNHGVPKLMTIDEADGMKSGKDYFAAYGIITYDDVFHVHHWTKFCSFDALIMAPDAYNAKACTEFNSTDTQ